MFLHGLFWHCALLQSRATDLLLVLQSKCGRHREISGEACEVRLPSLGTGSCLCRKLLAPWLSRTALLVLTRAALWRL